MARHPLLMLFRRQPGNSLCQIRRRRHYYAGGRELSCLASRDAGRSLSCRHYSANTLSPLRYAVEDDACSYLHTPIISRQRLVARCPHAATEFEGPMPHRFTHHANGNWGRSRRWAGAPEYGYRLTAPRRRRDNAVRTGTPARRRRLLG